jgi:hypothetical protein
MSLLRHECCQLMTARHKEYSSALPSVLLQQQTSTMVGTARRFLHHNLTFMLILVSPA